MANEATIVSPPAAEIAVDGNCLVATLANLESGHGSKPMPAAALAKIRSDATNLLAKVVDSYEKDVAHGEVGSKSSARASKAAAISGRCPTGLLYGRVQSGKTVAMISFCAAAIDNGFRVIIVLTTDFLKLVEQTADRFGALDGALIRNSLEMENWPRDRDHIAKHIADHGAVFICTKNQQKLAALVDFLSQIGAGDYPALVLDDEADQATLDTTVQARSAARPNAPTQPSVIHRRTVQDEEGHSIRQTLRHHVFLQVTATPYALLLQNVDSELRPQFTHLLEPGVGYTGGEAFFDADKVEEDAKPPLVFVSETESAEIEESDGGDPPLGLQQAIAFFLVAAGAQNLREPASRSSGQNFLCHTSQKTVEHDRVARLIVSYLGRVSDDLKANLASSETAVRLHGGYAELLKTMPDAPSFDEIVGRIKARLPRRTTPIVNSANSPMDFARELNFIVGGNILGRGLTIDNLLVTYYLRRAKISQMDTVLQHARMYGYRAGIMPYTRVFLPEELAARFHFIHTAEQSLRRQLAIREGSKIAVEVMPQALRATRLNVLDTTNLAAYEPGQHVYPGAPALDRKSLDRAPEIESRMKGLIGASLPEGFTEVPVTDLIELLKTMPFDSDNPNTWDPEMLEKILKRTEGRWQKSYVFFRKMDRKKTPFPTGALGGPELAEARSKQGPVLACFRDNGRYLAGGRTFWYPTLVFPADMPTHVYNTTA